MKRVPARVARALPRRISSANAFAMYVAMVQLILRSGGRADAIEFIDRSLSIGDAQATQVLDYFTAIATPLQRGQEALAGELLAGLGSALPPPAVAQIEGWIAQHRPTARARAASDLGAGYLDRLAQGEYADPGA